MERIDGILKRLEELEASSVVYPDDEYAEGWVDAVRKCISVIKEYKDEDI